MNVPVLRLGRNILGDETNQLGCGPVLALRSGRAGELHQALDEGRDAFGLAFDGAEPIAFITEAELFAAAPGLRVVPVPVLHGAATIYGFRAGRAAYLTDHSEVPESSFPLLSGLDVLFLENVGNLVCPSSYDLGEAARAVLISTTEGEDKPLKYPTMFNTADVVVITKMDLADAVGFDRALCRENIDRARPGVPVIELSSRSGVGLDAWFSFVRGERV